MFKLRVCHIKQALDVKGGMLFCKHILCESLSFISGWLLHLIEALVFTLTVLLCFSLCALHHSLHCYMDSVFGFSFLFSFSNGTCDCLSQISPYLLNRLELCNGEQSKALNQLERVLLFKKLKVSLSLLPFCKHLWVVVMCCVAKAFIHVSYAAWLWGRMHVANCFCLG